MKKETVIYFKDIVREVLESDKDSRDDDIRLYVLLMKKKFRINNENLHELSAYDFLKLMQTHKLPQIDTIARYRRELQRLCPELRGKKYFEKQMKESEVIKDMLILEDHSNYSQTKVF